MDVGHMHRLYLKAGNLPENGCTIPIEKVTVEKLHSRPGVASETVVLWFKDKSQRLRAFPLNQGNFNRLVNYTNSTNTDDWLNKTVRLTPGTWGDKQTIILAKP